MVKQIGDLITVMKKLVCVAFILIGSRITAEPEPLTIQRVEEVAQLAVITVGARMVQNGKYFHTPPSRLYFQNEKGKFQVLEVGHNRLVNFNEVAANTKIFLKRKEAPNVSEYYSFVELPELAAGSQVLCFIRNDGVNKDEVWSKGKVIAVMVMGQNGKGSTGAEIIQKVTVLNLSDRALRISRKTLGKNKSITLSESSLKSGIQVKTMKGSLLADIPLNVQVGVKSIAQREQLIVLYQADAMTNRGKSLGFFSLVLPE
ncbi:hypothetical protein OAB00_02255 [Akkermansiaceae bacterium]|nr:hypothetical protein [Akkermansiaceae bacterium]